jgi:hypothetical protein
VKADPTVTRVSLGQCAVEIECQVPELAEHLAFLLDDTSNQGGDVQTRFVIVAGDKKKYHVLRGDKICYRGSSPGELCTYLVGEIIYHLIENNSRELLIHAACLKRGDVGILLPGASGSGKSTICAWLLTRGFEYLTDELVCIDPQTFEVEAFTRPLNIKHGGMQVVRNRFGEDFDGGESLEGSISHLVPHRLLGSTYGGSRSAVRAIVFPRYSSSADYRLETLSTARTALLLMQTFVNARNHVEHGFHRITAFARTVTGYELHYSDFSQLGELEQRLGDLSTTPIAPPLQVPAK